MSTQDEIFHKFIDCFCPLQAAMLNLNLVAGEHPDAKSAADALRNLNDLAERMKAVRSAMVKTQQ